MAVDAVAPLVVVLGHSMVTVAVVLGIKVEVGNCQAQEEIQVAGADVSGLFYAVAATAAAAVPVEGTSTWSPCSYIGAVVWWMRNDLITGCCNVKSKQTKRYTATR